MSAKLKRQHDSAPPEIAQDDASEAHSTLRDIIELMLAYAMQDSVRPTKTEPKFRDLERAVMLMGDYPATCCLNRIRCLIDELTLKTEYQIEARYLSQIPFEEVEDE